MPRYRYTAFDISGELSNGSIVAANREDASAELEKLGFMVSSLRSSLSLGKSERKVSPKLFFQFNKELVVLVRAGVPLTEAISLLASNSENGSDLSSTLARVHQHLIDGESFSAACAWYSEVFDPVYIASVQMGEHTGRLDAALDNYQLYLKRRITIDRTIKQSLSYPLFLLSTLAVVFVVLFIVVIPKFSTLYESFGAELPMPTQIVLMTANVVPVLLIIGTLIVAMGTIFWRRWDKPLSAYHRLDSVLLSIPVVGAMRQCAQQSRCMRMIGGLLAAGTSLLSAVNVTQVALSRFVVGQALQQAAVAIESGRSFSSVLGDVGLLNEQSLKMLQVGESTGTLSDMLNEIADYYEGILDDSLGRFTSLFEPILMVVVGVLIGAVILAMYLPIFFLAEVVQ